MEDQDMAQDQPGTSHDQEMMGGRKRSFGKFTKRGSGDFE